MCSPLLQTQRGCSAVIMFPSHSVLCHLKKYILPVQLSQMYHTFRKIFNFGFYLNILDKPPSKFILKKNSASY